MELQKDEIIVKKLLDSHLFKKTLTNVSNEELIKTLVQKLELLYSGHPLIVTLTAGPGAGKATLLSHITNLLQQNNHPTDTVTTDSFAMYTREERNRLIEEEKVNPWNVKDWGLLNRIVDNVRDGKEVKSPEYDESTGNATVVGEENFSHTVSSNLHFFFVEGDFQPVLHPDFKIYFHVPTHVRRENRVDRDMKKRNWESPEKIIQSFDYRLESQYYPYTLPQAELSDFLIITHAKKATNGEYLYSYTYDVYIKS